MHLSLRPRKGAVRHPVWFGFGAGAAPLTAPPFFQWDADSTQSPTINLRRPRYLGAQLTRFRIWAQKQHDI